MPLPIRVLSDTGRSIQLSVSPPSEAPPAAAGVWVSRVAPAPPVGSGPALPDAAPENIDSPLPPPLVIDPNLEPPLLKRSAPLVVPESWRRRGPRGARSVELDILVEESGEVSEVEWAGGSRDSVLVEAASQCARAMSFYPALRGSHPIAVWCRQRFDFGAR